MKRFALIALVVVGLLVLPAILSPDVCGSFDIACFNLG